jgi:hypothetical protein
LYTRNYPLPPGENPTAVNKIFIYILYLVFCVCVFFFSCYLHVKPFVPAIEVKVQQSLHRSGKALRVAGGFKISRQSAYAGVKVVSPMH